MSNFIFALNATMPVFLVIVLGWFLKKIGIINDAFAKAGNQYVFKCALPISLFNSISSMDFYSDFDPLFCLYCAGVSCVMFGGIWVLSFLFVKNKALIGAFAQASVRSSAALLGVAFAVNIYGTSGMVPMMIVAAVPIFNVFSVLILMFSPQVDENGKLLSKSEDKGWPMIRKALIGVVTNPIILGVIIGIPFAMLKIQLPEMFGKALSSVGSTASPIALIVVGASFSTGEAMSRLKPAIVSSIIKLMILPMIFLPLAALLGFKDSQMVAILIMVGSPTTVSAYIMAKSMHGDAVLSSNAVVLSTLFSSVTITLWIYFLKTFSLI